TTTTTQSIPTTTTTPLAEMKAIFSTTSTFTSTNTITEFSTVSTKVTSTSSTTTTVTTNVLAPPGLVCIEESSGDIDATPVKARRALSRGVVSRRASQRSGNPTGDKTYPVKVTCVKTVQLVIFKKIVAVKPTSTKTLPASTTTVTSTTRPTLTSTVPGSAVTSTASFQTTIAINSTTTMVTTTTAMTTTTITESSTTSSYLACATTNQLGPNLSDGRVSTIFDGSETDLFYSTDVYDATSPYECCVACLLSPFGCYASGFFVNFDIPYDRDIDPNTFNRATYSNGPCGVAQKGPDTG
ncbi:MAG: hypothetical protein LQ349_007507, partial [Xanthoria aureola]